MDRRLHGYCFNHVIVVYWCYESLSRALMVWSKEDWDSEGWDSEGLVIWLLRGGNRWCGCVDWLKVYEWGRINDWDEEEGILVGDGGLWIWVCGGREELYTVAKWVDWGCIWSTCCEGREAVGCTCCDGKTSWRNEGCIWCCCCGIFGIIWRTTSFIVWSITFWKDEKHWLKYSVIARLFSRNFSAISSLKEDSMSFLKELLLVSSILRKSS